MNETTYANHPHNQNLPGQDRPKEVCETGTSQSLQASQSGLHQRLGAEHYPTQQHGPVAPSQAGCKYFLGGLCFNTKEEVKNECRSILARTEKNEALAPSDQLWMQELLTYHHEIKQKTGGLPYELRKCWVGDGPGACNWNLRIYSLEGFPGDDVSWVTAVTGLKPYKP